MKIKHSKFKNTGLIYELLVKQIAADTLSKNESPALGILRKYFAGKTTLAKELKLYEYILKNTNLAENKAETVISSITEISRKLNQQTLKNQKYNLISEIKDNYDIDEFFGIQVRDYKPLCVGIERCISYQAVMPPLLDMMRRNNFFFHIEEILHNNVKKIDRVIWALQGRFENGIITLNKGAWNSRFLDELFQFPDILTHDDLVDSLAYIDQLAKVTYGGNYEELSDFEIIDSVAGY